MPERGKPDRGILGIVDTESLVPENPLLRKIDAAVDFDRLYEAHAFSCTAVSRSARCPFSDGG